MNNITVTYSSESTTVIIVALMLKQNNKYASPRTSPYRIINLFKTETNLVWKNQIKSLYSHVRFVGIIYLFRYQNII